MTKRDKARQWRAKYPEKPTRALARMLYSKNKLLFRDYEDARKVLAEIEGKRGGGRTKVVVESDLYRPEQRPVNPYNLPPSDETIWEPYILKAKRVLVLSDIHAPYHNIVALTLAIDYAKKEKVDAVLILGDLFDFHRMSKYEKDPTKKKFNDEINIGVEIIKVLLRELNCPVYFKMGNHDERYDKYMNEKNGELEGVQETELQFILNNRLGQHLPIIGDKRIVKLNSLNAIHGHEFYGSATAAVNIARGLFNKGKASAIQGHNHQTSEHTEPTMDGKMITTWSLGCLSELNPRYMPLNKWNHGFAVVYLHENGEDFEVHNKRIYKGRIF
jgi:predicted phosphodiesterase